MAKIVTIIASLSQENDIKKARDNYTKLGYIVDYPRKQYDKEFSKIVEDYLFRISTSDRVIAITKDDGSFGVGSIYELAFAKYLDKPITILEPKDLRES